MPGRPNGTKPEYLRHDDVRREFSIDYTTNTIIDNKVDYEAAAKHYLDTRQQQLQLSLPASVTYAGGKAINPDGAIWQVTWETTSEGFCYTRASRNREELTVSVSYEERRRQEKFTEILREREAAATERAREERRGKGAA
jgi:hypothetical protein